MEPHPAAVERPQAFWDFTDPHDADLWRDPSVHSYRPDWFAEATQQALPGSIGCAQAYASPACAFELLRKNFPQTGGHIEPALYPSAEYTSRFLCWAHKKGVTPKGKQSQFRGILRTFGPAAERYAKATHDRSLMAEAAEWAADERRSVASGAAWFLAHHPREPVGPYRELLRSAPAFVYWALPWLKNRGFTLGAADAAHPQWAYNLALSQFSAAGDDYRSILQRDPVWLVGYLLTRDGRIAPRLARETAAQLQGDHPRHPLLPRALAILSRQAEPAIPPVLASGQKVESSALEQLHRAKNRDIYRPTEGQIESEEFKHIVGPARYTPRGYAQGTVMDVADGAFAEIKSGSSVLEPTYQLKLQAFRALAENRPLVIYTNRQISPELREKIAGLPVAIEPLPQ